MRIRAIRFIAFSKTIWAECLPAVPSNSLESALSCSLAHLCSHSQNKPRKQPEVKETSLRFAFLSKLHASAKLASREKDQNAESKADSLKPLANSKLKSPMRRSAALANTINKSP